MTDLILTTVPYTEADFPLPAIAVLKAVAESVGWSCKTFDFNAIVCKETRASVNHDQLIDWFFHERYYPEIANQIMEMFDKFSDEIASHNPKIVGISLFAYPSQISAKYLAIKIREKCPKAKIIFGGSGIYDNVEGDHTFIDNMMAMNLVDHYITGDAEISFAEFLKGNSQTLGVDSSNWRELTSEQIRSVPYPDYSDFDWSLYEIPAIPVTGSRGCVRKCKFCNYIVHWTKFVSRTGNDIFSEMIYQKKQYGINLFSFTDTLINGNLIEFKNLIRLIAEYNESNPLDKISWESYFIFRPKHQFDAEAWDLLARSNPDMLHVGIESLSERIRFDMGKKFNQADMEFNLEQAKKHGIKIQGLLIVGYPLEDETDIDYAKDWLSNNKRFSDIMRLQWGGTMAIFPGSELYRNKEKYGIELYGPPWQQWSNPQSDPKKRVRWLKELSAHSKSSGFDINGSYENESVVNTLMTYDHLQPQANHNASDLERYNEL